MSHTTDLDQRFQSLKDKASTFGSDALVALGQFKANIERNSFRDPIGRIRRKSPNSPTQITAEACMQLVETVITRASKTLKHDDQGTIARIKALLAPDASWPEYEQFLASDQGQEALEKMRTSFTNYRATSSVPSGIPGRMPSQSHLDATVKQTAGTHS